jgi:cellulose synthase/poly-beta-1,6-N-acetylglucosamine synthase-like glycosyltransferase
MPRTVSIVVATRDRPGLLRTTLADLAIHVRKTDEVIVVDSASRNGAVGRIAVSMGGRLVRSAVPGTSRARNVGLAATRAPIVAFIDDDCSVTAGWSERIERAFDDPTLGFVTGRVVADRQTSLQSSVFDDERPRRFETTADPSSFGGGSNMAFRREALLAIGGFDEALGPATSMMAAEDQDVFWRLIRAGWSGAYDPDVCVVHRQWRTPGQAIRREYAYGVGAGALAVKLLRLRDPFAKEVLRARLWSDGPALFARNIRRGYKSGALAAILRFAGVVVGLIRGLLTRIVDDRFDARSQG